MVGSALAFEMHIRALEQVMLSIRRAAVAMSFQSSQIEMQQFITPVDVVRGAQGQRDKLWDAVRALEQAIREARWRQLGFSNAYLISTPLDLSTLAAEGLIAPVNFSETLAGSGRGDEDYYFTPEDFMIFRAAGGRLTFHPSSAWVPENMKANILAVLDYTLDPYLMPPVTTGVNYTLDLYHGHPGAASHTPDQLAFVKAIQVLSDSFTTAFTVVPLQGENYISHPEVLFPILQSLWAPVYSMLFKQPDAAVLYHTYENSNDPNWPLTDIHNDPRRMILTTTQGTASGGEMPPNTIQGFSFMITQDGQILVQPFCFDDPPFDFMKLWIASGGR